jgi:dCTP diphosphatase
MQDSLEHLRATINAFVAERDWAQFHTPKNLAMAMIVEAAELVEQFQWDTPQESQSLTPEKREAVSHERLILLSICCG